MRPSVLCTVGTLLVLLLLSGCGLAQQMAAARLSNATPLPAHPLYVLEVHKEDELAIVDTTTWQVARRTPLLNESAWDLTIDPQGRIWIGYGAAPEPETRVQVLAPDGRLLKTLSACLTPYLPIHFAAGRAFISCLQNGFYATVLVVDLTSLEVVEQVDIRIPDDSFLLVATGGDENYFVLAGGGRVSNRVVFLDTHTLALLEPLLIPASHPVTILADKGRFLLLNSVAGLAIHEGWSKPLPEGRPDLLIVEPKAEPALTIYEMVAPGAVWGVIKGDTLYAYHDAQQIGLTTDPFRAVSRLNLITHEADFWLLPDNWNAEDIVLVDGEIVLTHNDSQQPDQSGLFRFNPVSGEMTLLTNIYGAQRILLGK